MDDENQRHITVGLTTKEARRVRDELVRAAGALHATDLATPLIQAVSYMTNAIDSPPPGAWADGMYAEKIAAEADTERAVGKLEQLKARLVDHGWTEDEEGEMQPPPEERITITGDTGRTTLADVAAAIHAEVDRQNAPAPEPLDTVAIAVERDRIKREVAQAWDGIDRRIRGLLGSRVLGG